MPRNILREIHRNETGHVPPFLASAVAGAGAVALGIGEATDTGWLAIAGGVVAGLGIIAYDVIRHTTLDKGFFGRLDKLDR